MRSTGAPCIAFSLAAIVGCATASPNVVPRPDVEVRYSSLDIKAACANSVVAPAMVAVYRIDDQGYSTFSQQLSSQAGDSLNTLLEYRAGAPLLDLERVNATPLIAAEFYNRMDRATTSATNYCLHNKVCSKEPFWFGAPVSRKLTAWNGPLGARYVVFLRFLGSQLTPEARDSRLVTGVVLGGAIGGVIAANLPANGGVASAAVVDLADGRIVWFKVKPIADSRSLAEMRGILDGYLRELF